MPGPSKHGDTEWCRAFSARRVRRSSSAKPAAPTSTRTNTPTNCRFATAPFRNSAERNDLQAVFYATTSPNATVTTTYVTGSPAYPPTAFLVIARPHSKATVTTLSGALANGHYQYTFNDGPEGLAALIFLIPSNAALGTVTVNSSAVEACGGERSTTGFTVKTDEAESGFGDAEANSGSVTMAYTLPDGFAVPAGIATATSGAVSLVTTRKGGEAIRTLVFSVQLPQPK